jgi:hypothetical protein
MALCGLFACQREGEKEGVPIKEEKASSLAFLARPIEIREPTPTALQLAKAIKAGEREALQAPLAAEALTGLDAKTLYWGRQMLLARHQKRFDDPTTQAFFQRFKWYQGAHDDVSAMLTPSEKKNLGLLDEALDRALERWWQGEVTYRFQQDQRTYSLCRDRRYGLDTLSRAADGSCCPQRAYGRWYIQGGVLYLQQTLRCEGRGRGKKQGSDPKKSCAIYPSCYEECKPMEGRNHLLSRKIILTHLLTGKLDYNPLVIGHQAWVHPDRLSLACLAVQKAMGVTEDSSLSESSQPARPTLSTQPHASAHLNHPEPRKNAQPTTPPQLPPSEQVSLQALAKAPALRASPQQPSVQHDTRDATGRSSGDLIKDPSFQGNPPHPAQRHPASPTDAAAAWASVAVIPPMAVLDGWWAKDHRYVMSVHAFGKPFQSVRWEHDCEFPEAPKWSGAVYKKRIVLDKHGWKSRISVVKAPSPQMRGRCTFRIHIGNKVEEKIINFPREDSDGVSDHVRFFHKWIKKTYAKRHLLVMMQIQTARPYATFRWHKFCAGLRSVASPRRKPFRYQSKGSSTTNEHGWGSRMVMLYTYHDFDGACSVAVTAGGTRKVFHHTFDSKREL